jgi:hypothetical protein
MISSRNVIVALAVTGGAAVAAILAVRRRKQRLEAVQHRRDLQTWEHEGGGTRTPSSLSQLPSEGLASPVEPA